MPAGFAAMKFWVGPVVWRVSGKRVRAQRSAAQKRAFRVAPMFAARV